MIIKERINGGQFAVILAAFLLFYKIRPYFFWHGIFESNYTNALVTIVLGVVFLFNLRKMDKTNKILMSIFGVILLSFPFVGATNFNVFVSIAPLLFLPFATDVFSKKVFDSFTFIYCIVVAISLFVWVFALIGVIYPYKVIPPLNELKDYNYYVYPLLVRSSYSSIRFFGPFDEPGVIGTMSGLFLCCQKKLYDKKSIIILLSGVCSLSLFFFVIVALYFSYTLLIARGKSKNLSVYLIIVFAIIFVGSSSSIFSERIFSRLAFDSSSGMFVGDNRTSQYAIDLFRNMIGTRAFWIGIDDKWGFHETVAYSSSFLNVIIMYGVVFSSLIAIFYFAYGWVNKISSASFLMYFAVVAGTLYQRPEIFDPAYIFLFTFLARKGILYQSFKNQKFNSVANKISV